MVLGPTTRRRGFLNSFQREIMRSFVCKSETHEMVEEETVVDRETRIVECERLALVWGGRDDDLSDAHIFEVGT